MGGFLINKCVKKLYENHRPNQNILKLYRLVFQEKCSFNQLMDHLVNCLCDKSFTKTIAEYFSPILLELLYRLRKESKLSLFLVINRLIGSYAIVTDFAYECFNDHLFEANDLLNETKNDYYLMTEFFESCLILLSYDYEYFFKNFQWSFIVDYSCQSSSHKERMVKRIRSKLTNSLTNSDNHCTTLYELTKPRKLYLVNHTIEYHDDCDDENLICDEDFSENLICVQGILLPICQQSASKNINIYDDYVSCKTFKKYLKSIALGVSLNRPILIEGPMSSGKSTLIKRLATLVRRYDPPSIMTIQISEQIDMKYLLGSYITTDLPGEFVFNYGPLLKSICEGNWIIFEDIDSASSELISSIISIIEAKNSTADIVGYESKITKFHNQFRIFFTQTSSKNESTIKSINFNMLERICYKIRLENLTSEQMLNIIDKKWPNLKLLQSRIINIFENVNKFHTEIKSKRTISFRDLLKWCNRLSKYQFTNISNEPDLMNYAFLDCIDCFLMFIPSTINRQKIIEEIGTYFNLSKNECQNLLYQRNPKIIKDNSRLTIGRQMMMIDTKFSQNLFNFAYTLNTTQLLERLFVSISNREHILLCGETGIGKTYCVQYLANICGKNLNIINMNQQSNSQELFGGYKPVDYKQLIKMVKNDYCTMFEQTFEAQKNEKFIKKFDSIYQKQDLDVLIQIMLHVSEKALKKLENSVNGIDNELRDKWLKLKDELKNFNSIMNDNNDQNRLTFNFIDGILTEAIRDGQWILLDELNLAENETLECLLSFMENDETLMLFEKSNDNQFIKVHKNFRLFACMNPATDVGKKELPTKLRNRFTEFFIEEFNDRQQLRTLVRVYVENLIDTKTIESIVEFYQNIKQDTQINIGLIKDMNGNRPIFSLRNLCRALYVIKSNPFKSIQRSILEGFSLAFLSNLDQQSYLIVQKRIEKIININDRENFLKNQEKNLQKLFPTKNYVIIENYPIIKGPNEPFIDENYILTDTVIKNLKDICRIISAGRTYPILLQGETSVGKTSLIQWLAKATGNVCHRINNHEHTDLEEYVGNYCSQNDGKILFKNGILIEAMKNGHWIILDELNLASTEILEALNRVLDENREYFIVETQELIRAHPRFILFATQNPPGKYAGRKQLSRAFRNRFIELNFNEIPVSELEIILYKKCQMPLSYSKRMLSVLTQLQKCRTKSDIFAGKNGLITLRDLFRWGNRYAKFSKYYLDENVKFFDWNQFLANQGFMLLAGRIRRNDDVLIIKNIIESVFRCQIDIEHLYYDENDEFNESKIINNNKIVWTKPYRRLHRLLTEAIKFQEPILLIGETGCGKTTICQYFAEKNEKSLKIINCHMNTESSDFLGCLRPYRNDNHQQQKNIDCLFEWIDGPLIEAMKNGDYFLIDEISLADDSVLERLNSVLELERTIFLAERNEDTFERIKANDTFRLFATMNPGGDFGKKELSPALRDRFTEIWCPNYDNYDDIELISYQNLDIDDNSRKLLSKMIRNFIEWWQQSIISHYCNQRNFIISIRDILSWIEFINVTVNNGNNANRSMKLYDSFVNGCYLIYIDPFIISNKQSNRIDCNEIDLKCNKFLNDLRTHFNIENSMIDGSETNDIDNGQWSFGKFSFEKPLITKNNKQNYYWQSPTVKNNSIRLLRALQLHKPILLEGPPGVGKTSLIQALSTLCNVELIRINLSDQTDINDLFGSDLPVENIDDNKNGLKFKFYDGPFLKALKNQHPTWILLDELNLASQTVLEGLNACLDHRGEIYIAELNKTFHVNRSNNRIFATQNPFTMDNSRKRLPKSFLNRFTIVFIENLNDYDYQLILINMFPQISSEIIEKIVQINRKICDKFNNEFNLRDLIRWIELIIEFEGKLETFFPIIYMNRMSSIENRQKMQEIFDEEFNDDQNKERPIMFYLNDSLFQFGLGIVERSSMNLLNNKHMYYCLKNQASIIESILICIKMNWLTILIGDNGIGKSYLIKLIANILNHKLIIINANTEMDTIDLLGSYEQIDLNYDLKLLKNDVLKYCIRKFQNDGKSSSENELWKKFFNYIYELSTETYQIDNDTDSIVELISKLLNLFNDDDICISLRKRLKKFTDSCKNFHHQNGKFQWRDSSLIRSIKNGDWVLIENANLLNSAILDRFNGLFEPNGSIILNEKGLIDDDGQIEIIRSHPEFRLFFTMNPKYGELSSAMRNRALEIFMIDNNDYHDDFENISKEFNVNTIPDEYSKNPREFFQYIENQLLSSQLIGHNDSIDRCNNVEKYQYEWRTLKFNNYFSDPIFYYVINDYEILFDYFKHKTMPENRSLKSRLYIERSSVYDFNIRLQKSYLGSDSLRLYQNRYTKIYAKLEKSFASNFKLIQQLPIDMRENKILCSLMFKNDHQKYIEWNKELNNFHLNLFWIEMKNFRLSSFHYMKFNFSSLNQKFKKILNSINNFLSSIMKHFDDFLDNFLPNDEEIIEYHKIFILFYQILIVYITDRQKNFDNNKSAMKFLNEKFFPLWFLLNEKNYLAKINLNTDLMRDVNEVNKYFNIKRFDFEKYEFVSEKICKNLHLKFEPSNHSDHYRLMRRLIEYRLESSSIGSIDFYFNPKISHQKSSENCLININNEHHKVESFINGRLYEFEQYMDYFVEDKNNDRKYIDLLAIALINFNHRSNILNLIDHYSSIKNDHHNLLQYEICNLNKFKINDKLKQNITIDLIPTLSIIYFYEQIIDPNTNMNNPKITIKEFHRKKSQRKIYEHLLKSKYLSVKLNLNQTFQSFQRLTNIYENILEEKFENFQFINDQREKFKNNEKFYDYFDLILIGFTLFNYSKPNYSIDPIVRMKIELSNLEQNHSMINDELLLKKLLFRQMCIYPTKQPEEYCFENKIDQNMQEHLKNMNDKIQKLKNSTQIYRKSAENYYELVKNFNKFQTKILDWNNFDCIIQEINNIMINDDDRSNEMATVITKCLMYYQSLNDFIGNLQKKFFEYNDLITPTIVGMLIIMKGLQLLIFKLQSELHTNLLSSITKSMNIFEIFTKYLSTNLPTEICAKIADENHINQLSSYYKRLNLDRNFLMKNLLQMILFEMKNSLYLNEQCKIRIQQQTKIFSIILNIFIEKFKKIEQENVRDEIRKNALYHIKLDDEQHEKENDKIINELFLTYENEYNEFLPDNSLNNQQESDKQIEINNGINDTLLLFIANLHIDMIELSENNSLNQSKFFQSNFVYSYLIRYKIILNIVSKTFGILDYQLQTNENIEQNLIDGHVLYSKFCDSNVDENENNNVEIQIEKCFKILESLRLKIENELLRKFNDNPILLKLLKIIEHIYNIDYNKGSNNSSSSTILMCLAIGLELILKTSEEWQVIAHKKISLNDHLNQLTELLIDWKKIEINYWLNCLQAISDKIIDKDLINYWLRFYLIIDDFFINNNNNDTEIEDNVKQFVNSMKIFIENSTIGQFEIRMKLMKIFRMHIEYNLLKAGENKEKIFETLCLALKNVYNFYYQFSDKINEQTMAQKLKIENELKDYIKIFKWNPNNFWSLKQLLVKSKKQLFNILKKYQQYLSQPVKSMFVSDKSLIKQQQQKHHSHRSWNDNLMKIMNLKNDYIDDSKWQKYNKKVFILMKQIHSKNQNTTIENLEKFSQYNSMIIENIEKYSVENLTEINDKLKMKKQLAQLQQQKRRKLYELFEKFNIEYGLKYRKGLNRYENGFNLIDTIYYTQPLSSIKYANDHPIAEIIESCNDYYYKNLSIYTSFVENIVKPNKQLTIDMIDRIKGFNVHLLIIVNRNRKILLQKIEKYNQIQEYLNKLENNIENDTDDDDQNILMAIKMNDFKSLLNEIETLLLKFQAFIIRLRLLMSSFDISDDFMDGIIENNRKILKQIQSYNENLLFVTKFKFELFFENVINEFKKRYELLIDKMNEKEVHEKFLQINMTEFQYFENQIKSIEIEYQKQLSTSSRSLATSNDCKNHENLLKNILFSIENLYKFSIDSNDKQQTDELTFIEQLDRNCEILNLFNSQRISRLIEKFFRDLDDITYQISSIKQLKILAIFMKKYQNLYQYFLHLSLISLKISSKLSYIFMSLSNELLMNGFCLPSNLSEDDLNDCDNKDSNKNEQEKNIDNAGFGDGNLSSNAKDVSDRLDCQDQLDDLKNDTNDGNDDNNAEQQEQNKNEDNGIEMDDNFSGNEYGPDNDNERENNESDNNENDDEDLQDLDDEFGQVENNEQILDEKLWNDEEDDKNDDVGDDENKDGNANEDNEQITGGKEDYRAKKVANTDNDELKSQKNDANNNIEDDNNEDDNIDDNLDEQKQINENDYQDNDIDTNTNKKEELDEMILPDDMQIDMDNDNDDEDIDDHDDDGQENMDTSDINDDDNDVNSNKEIENDNDNNDDDDNEIEKDEQCENNNDISQKDDQQIDDDQTLAANSAIPNQQQTNDTEFPNYDEKINNTDNNEQNNQSNQENVDDSKSNQSLSKNDGHNDENLININDDNDAQDNEQNDEQKFSMLKKKKNRCLANEDDHEPERQIKKLKITNDSNEKRNKIDKTESMESQANLYRHVEEKRYADNLAYDIDYGQQEQQQQNNENDEKPLERGVNFNEDDNNNNNNNNDLDNIDKTNNQKSSSRNENNEMKNENNTLDDEEMIIDGEFIQTMNVSNRPESTFRTNVDDDQTKFMEIDEEKSAPIDDTMALLSSESDYDDTLLKESEKRIEPLLYELCNQLMLVLEPTKRSKYKGDFKSGKRLNMRKVIAYIASQFRKDKIWLRRIKPNKRKYQILIAIDDSLSMSDNQSRMMAFDSLILLAKSLSIIESGLLSVISFGNDTRVLHPFGDPFTDQTVMNIFKKLQFDQTATKTNEMLKCSFSMFSEAKQLSSISSATSFHQLLLIVSDGRGIFSEGEMNIRSSIMRLKELGVFIVYIIIDNPANKNSILDIQTPIFDKNDNSMKIESYISQFPFPYYVILKDVQSLPMILGDALRQWLELIAYNV